MGSKRTVGSTTADAGEPVQPGTGGRSKPTVTVELDAELVESARALSREIDRLSSQGKSNTLAYWAKVGELELLNLELIGAIYDPNWKE